MLHNETTTRTSEKASQSPTVSAALQAAAGQWRTFLLPWGGSEWSIGTDPPLLLPLLQPGLLQPLLLLLCRGALLHNTHDVVAQIPRRKTKAVALQTYTSRLFLLMLPALRAVAGPLTLTRTATKAVSTHHMPHDERHRAALLLALESCRRS